MLEGAHALLLNRVKFRRIDYSTGAHPYKGITTSLLSELPNQLWVSACQRLWNVCCFMLACSLSNLFVSQARCTTWLSWVPCQRRCGPSSQTGALTPMSWGGCL